MPKNNQRRREASNERSGTKLVQVLQVQIENYQFITCARIHTHASHAENPTHALLNVRCDVIYLWLVWLNISAIHRKVTFNVKINSPTPFAKATPNISLRNLEKLYISRSTYVFLFPKCAQSNRAIIAGVLLVARGEEHCLGEWQRQRKSKTDMNKTRQRNKKKTTKRLFMQTERWISKNCVDFSFRM